MRPIRLHPPFDHGAALRVPPPSDQASWRTLWMWLGEAAQQVIEGAAVQVTTADGPVVARCGDWIVLSHSGDFHVAHSLRGADA